MPRLLLLCLTIVAAFPSPLVAADPPIVMAPVPPAVLATARALGLDPERDRARFLPELVRLLHGGPDNRTAHLDALRRADGERSMVAGPGAVRVSVPLGPEVWSTAILKRRVTLDSLVGSIATDRRAALLAAGLSLCDDETLAYLSTAPLLLGQLHERGAPGLAAFGGSLRIRDGRIVPPGGDEAVAMWEAVVGAPVSAPDRFVLLLLGESNGRLGYLYDTIAQLDRPRAAFALGLTMADPVMRLERFHALAAVALHDYHEWRPDILPYSRPVNDLVMLLLRLSVDDEGRMRPPAARTFWADVWKVSSEPASASGRPPSDLAGPLALPGEGPVDAAFLTDAAAVGTIFERGDRLDQIGFAQRVFGGVAPSQDVVQTVRALPRQKMLLLTLERLGVRSPELFAFVSRLAAALEIDDTNRGFWVMAQMQSALALVARMTAVGTLEPRTAEAMVRSLFTVPLDDRQRYAGALVRWVVRELAPKLPQATSVEASLIQGLAGPEAGDAAPRVEWEGARYRVDPSVTDAQRLRAVRDKQGGASADLAVELERLATRLGASGLDIDDVTDVQRDLALLIAVHGPALNGPLPDVPSGVSVPRRGRDLDRASAEIAQVVRTRDPRRAARQASALLDLADMALGESLLSLAYATYLGDPSGAALLARNVALRHDFGFGHNGSELRSRLLWAIPRQDFQPGVAWHVTGSALGLDIALARSSLTRINADRLAGAPRLSSTERDGFAVGLALMDPRRLDDETRDAIAAAIDRGDRRVEAMARRQEPIDSVADDLKLDALRRRSIRLAVEEAPDLVPDLFSLSERLVLGGFADVARLHAWGTNGLPLSGCPCTRFVPASEWRLLAGRPQVPLISAAVAELNLRIIVGQAELGLPSALTKPILASAVQDFVEDAGPSDGGDWWALSRTARAVTRERIEDYVAAAASVDGALVPEDDSDDTPDVEPDVKSRVEPDAGRDLTADPRSLR